MSAPFSSTMPPIHSAAGPIRNESERQAMSDRSPNLDVLRALAVSFVVTSHLLIEHHFTSIGSYHTQSLGTLGVLIFFVHTCLVLMQSLERQGRSYGHRSMALSFLIARAFRIYPMSIVVVVLVGLVDRISSHTHPTLFTFLSNVFLVQNLTGSSSVTPVLWSLPFEFQMYLFLPSLFIVASVATRHAWRWIAALWYVSVALVLLLWKLGLSFELIKFFPCFLPGVLAYCLRDTPKYCPSALLFGYVCAAATIFPVLVGLGCSATVLSWAICLVLGAIIPRCREVESRWLQQCGDTIARYSYGIYLVHVPILYLSFVYFHALPRLLAWLLFIGGVTTASYLAYHYIEKPGIAYGRALTHRLNVNRARPKHNA
jgi:peptidoglycan/LPS O-acetylase OafA/YrhL